MMLLNKKKGMMFFFLTLSILLCYSLSFRSKRISSFDSEKIEKLIKIFYANYECDDWDIIKKLFYENKINISIESKMIMENYNDYNFLGKIHNINEIPVYQFYKKRAGKILKTIYLSEEFDPQPYDYPIGNIYYVKLNIEYQNVKTNEYFFIVKDEEKFRIYELKIILL